jgi:molybdenum cofactor biosynthesis protein MoaC
MTELSHLDPDGQARMVDVTPKSITERSASASATVFFDPDAFRKVTVGELQKGNIFAVARVAGIMAAKRTADLIPLCHPLPLSHVSIGFEPDPAKACIHVSSSARVAAQTGVEMEALTAVAIAALTIYDMCKAVDRSLRISDIRLTEKAGGRSGSYLAD